MNHALESSHALQPADQLSSCADAPATSTSAVDETSETTVGDKETLCSSFRDGRVEDGPLNFSVASTKTKTMTVSVSSKNDDSEMVTVDEKRDDNRHVDKSAWRLDDVDGLSEEAMNLCSKDQKNEGATVMMSAKMRLKKQRLEATASHLWSSQSDALHQLAEVAERKQEEEMMEVESSTPRGSSTPSGSPLTHSPVHMTTLRPAYTTTTTSRPNISSVTRLTPLNEYEVSSSAHQSLTPTASPQLSGRHILPGHVQNFNNNKNPPTPSPDSAIHSACYSPSQSPIQSRHVSGLSSPFSLRTTPSLSRNNSDASQYGNPSSNVPPMGEASIPNFSPNQSPVQSRNPLLQTRLGLLPYHQSSGVILVRQDEVSRSSPLTPGTEANSEGQTLDGEDKPNFSPAQTGISRQQLINSPCPVCGDKISGFHYGIFSCESCKGFFKRTVQNKKNYVCLRGAQCPVSIATRKKCPACRFDKCLKTGMKLEAIREDRTRGGRSTYQCSYTIPAGLCPSPSSSSSPVPLPTSLSQPQPAGLASLRLSTESSSDVRMDSTEQDTQQQTVLTTGSQSPKVPLLLQEIMDVEHLWFSSRPSETRSGHVTNPEELQTLAEMADKRLYKLVKWCKSLPLFKNILIDDQIALLINAWCELLVFSCCFRSLNSPGIIRVSNDRILTLETAREFGIEKWVEKMLNFADHLRRLKVDYYEYVSMKVIVLLTSDASSLKEPEHVRDSQEKVVQALQQYTYSNYPNMPSKFAEMLLRIPELHRVCQLGKEMLCPRQPSEAESSGFNLLLELLRGDH